MMIDLGGTIEGITRTPYIHMKSDNTSILLEANSNTSSIEFKNSANGGYLRIDSGTSFIIDEET
jgi:hypothetical protein